MITRNSVLPVVWIIFTIVLVGLVGCGLSQTGASLANGNGRGIGGTGSPLSPDDRGIGGTGIVGTITEFGSIWVNGLEVELDDKTEIRLNNQMVTQESLRLGQQVAVLANTDENGIWHAEKVFINYVLSGTVDEVESDALVVDGITLRPDKHIPGHWPKVSVGQKLNVSGYFDDGTIYVTDAVVTENLSHEWQVTGTVVVDASQKMSVAGKVAIPDSVREAQDISIGDSVTVMSSENGNKSSVVFEKNVMPFKANHYLTEQRYSNGHRNLYWSQNPPPDNGDMVLNEKSVAAEVQEQILRGLQPSVNNEPPQYSEDNTLKAPADIRGNNDNFGPQNNSSEKGAAESSSQSMSPASNHTDGDHNSNARGPSAQNSPNQNVGGAPGPGSPGGGPPR